MTRDWRELDEEELREHEGKEREALRGWHPSVETIRAIEGEEPVEQEEHQVEKPSRADKMIDSMMEREGHADLTKPGAWGRFAHYAIQDALESEKRSQKEDVKVEKTVKVIKEDGTLGKGRYDVLMKDGLLEIKTTNLDRFSDSGLERELEAIARQVERYQRSPDLEGKPEATVFFEFAPESQERRRLVETFFQRHGIRVIWGRD